MSTLIFKRFNEQQTTLRLLLAESRFVPKSMDRNQFNKLLNEYPPVRPDMLSALLKEIELYSENAVMDEAQAGLMNEIMVSIRKLQRLNLQYANQSQAPELPPPPFPDFPPPPLLPEPSAPPPSLPVYPSVPATNPAYMPTPPQQQFIPPPVKVAEFKLRGVQAGSQQQADAMQNFVNQVTILDQMVDSLDDPIGIYNSVFAFLLGNRTLQVQYDGAKFDAVRTLLNKEISELFRVAASEQNELKFRVLNELLRQTHQVMFGYYQMRRLFNIKTVEEVMAGTKPPQAQKSGWFGEPIAAQDEDEDEDE